MAKVVYISGSYPFWSYGLVLYFYSQTGTTFMFLCRIETLKSVHKVWGWIVFAAKVSKPNWIVFSSLHLSQCDSQIHFIYEVLDIEIFHCFHHFYIYYYAWTLVSLEATGLKIFWLNITNM